MSTHALDGSRKRGFGRRGSVENGPSRWHHLVYVVSTLLPVFGGFAITPVLTRVLDIGDYAHVAMANLVVQNTGLLLALGLGAQIHLTTVEAGASAGRRVAIIGGLGGSAVGLLVLLLGALVPTDSLFAEVLPLGLVGGAAAAWTSNLLVLLRAQRRPAAYFGVSCLVTVAAPVLGVAAIWLSTPRWEVYLSFLYAGLACALTVALWLNRGPLDGPPRVMGESLRAGLPTLPHQLALYALPLALVAVVGASQGSAPAASLQIGLLIGSCCSLAVGALNSAWAPVVMSAAPGSRRAVADRLGPMVFWAAAAVSSAVVFVAPDLTVYLAPSGFDRALVVQTAIASSIAGFVSSVYFANSHHVQAARATKTLAVSTPIAAGAGLSVGLLAWLRLGWTPALSLVVANLLIAAWFDRVSTRATGYSVSARGYVPPALVCLTAAALAALCVHQPLVVRWAIAASLVVLCGLMVRRRQ